MKKSLKTSSSHQIIALFWEIGVVESSVEVRILTGSSDVAVSAHAPYKFGQNSPEQRI